ncbi:Trifunctional UDP-glucose 4,6-dehydratase/UDP-4-keto-6-deoxy-D-glucose 3,5-epimerase/UDP-4-keto-L-rhamnose-reductase RHM3 [Yarrowia sp. B02]|nr:Trifunctional UDP-glucose 4,6-dehydratase/UDP-4-keto-6-deoxy-D-glucose 3,5-epimerase/UDP-4-keto-L-rhamnose-reductase RHM3 [Yarrowia sp. B02]
MSVLVTGGAGFIGSWISRHFAEKEKVVCLDALRYSGRRKNLGNASLEFVHVDICETEALKHVFATHDIRTVIHAAAESHVECSYADPLNVTTTNVLGTQVLLEEMCRDKENIPRLIYISTDEIYGDQADLTGSEDLETSPLCPSNPYAASKAAAEMFISAYAKSYGLECVTLRFNNVYGEYQYPEKIIPAFCTAMLKGEECLLQGSGEHRRRYIYAEDCVKAVELAYKHFDELKGQVFNVGSREEKSNRDVFDALSGLLGYEKEPTFVSDRPYNDTAYRTNDDKIRELGWVQRVGFDEGLERTVRWYRENVGWWEE